MGWCHEFGPQIVDGCDHPMVAGTSTCTCAGCGAVCAGRFAGCADVWARGPRSVSVRVRPTEEPVRRSRPEPVLATAQDDTISLADLEAEVHSNGSGGGGPGAADTSTLVMLDHLWGKLRQLESAVASHDDRPPPTDARLEALSNAVAGLAGGLDRVFAEVRSLHELPKRLDALERGLTEQQSARIPYDQSFVERVEELAHEAGDLERLQARMEALEQTARRVVIESGGSAVAEQLDQVADKVTAFDKVGSRVTALEQAKRTSTDRDLATLAGRVTKLEREARPGEKAPPSAKLLDELERLSARVAVMEKAPKPAPGQSERLAATEKALGGLVQDLERLAAQVSSLAEVPKRMAALEEAPSFPPEKVLTSITKRLDRLTTQVSFYKDIPARVQATEESAARADALALGLRRAIESIDHLSARVKVLEQATSGAANKVSAPEAAPGAPPVSTGTPPTAPPREPSASSWPPSPPSPESSGSAEAPSTSPEEPPAPSGSPSPSATAPLT